MKTALQIEELLENAGVTLRREFIGKGGPAEPGSAMPEVAADLGLIDMVGMQNTRAIIRATNADLTEFDYITKLVCAVCHGDARKADRMLLWRKAGMLRDKDGKWLNRKQKAIARDLGVHRNTITNRLLSLYVELSNSTRLFVHNSVVQISKKAA
jgi:hypothetical protein